MKPQPRLCCTLLLVCLACLVCLTRAAHAARVDEPQSLKNKGSSSNILSTAAQSHSLIDVCSAEVADYAIARGAADAWRVQCVPTQIPSSFSPASIAPPSYRSGTPPQQQQQPAFAPMATVLPQENTDMWGPPVVLSHACIPGDCVAESATLPQPPLIISYFNVDSKDPNLPNALPLLRAWSTNHNKSLMLLRPNVEKYRPNLAATLKSSVGADVIAWQSLTLFADLCMDLTNLGNSTMATWQERYPPAVLKASMHQGRVIGIMQQYSFWGIWYDRLVFARLGLVPPTTWSELLHVCNVIRNQTALTPIGISHGDAWQGMMWWQMIAVRLGGVSWYNKFLAGEIDAVRDPVHIRAWQHVREIMPYWTQGGTSATDPYLSTVLKWVAGGTSVMVMSYGVAHTFPAAVGRPLTDVDFFQFPQLDASLEPEEHVEFSSFVMWAGNKETRNEKATRAFAEMLASDAFNAAFTSTLNGALPALRSARAQITNPLYIRGAKMMDDSPNIVTFIDALIPAWATRTKPMMVKFFTTNATSVTTATATASATATATATYIDEVSRNTSEVAERVRGDGREAAMQVLLQGFETVRQEVLLERVMPPIATFSSDKQFIVLTCSTANASIYYAIDLRAGSTAATTAAVAAADAATISGDSGYFLYGAPVPLSAVTTLTSVRVRAYAKSSVMRESERIETWFPVGNVIADGTHLPWQFTTFGCALGIIVAFIGAIQFLFSLDNAFRDKALAYTRGDATSRGTTRVQVSAPAVPLSPGAGGGDQPFATHFASTAAPSATLVPSVQSRRPPWSSLHEKWTRHKWTLASVFALSFFSWSVTCLLQSSVTFTHPNTEAFYHTSAIACATLLNLVGAAFCCACITKHYGAAVALQSLQRQRDTSTAGNSAQMSKPTKSTTKHDLTPPAAATAATAAVPTAAVQTTAATNAAKRIRKMVKLVCIYTQQQWRVLLACVVMAVCQTATHCITLNQTYLAARMSLNVLGVAMTTLFTATTLLAAFMVHVQPTTVLTPVKRMTCFAVLLGGALAGGAALLLLNVSWTYSTVVAEVLPKVLGESTALGSASLLQSMGLIGSACILAPGLILIPLSLTSSIYGYLQRLATLNSKFARANAGLDKLQVQLVEKIRQTEELKLTLAKERQQYQLLRILDACDLAEQVEHPLFRAYLTESKEGDTLGCGSGSAVTELIPGSEGARLAGNLSGASQESTRVRSGLQSVCADPPTPVGAMPATARAFASMAKRSFARSAPDPVPTLMDWLRDPLACAILTDQARKDRNTNEIYFLVLIDEIERTQKDMAFEARLGKIRYVCNKYIQGNSQVNLAGSVAQAIVTAVGRPTPKLDASIFRAARQTIMASVSNNTLARLKTSNHSMYKLGLWFIRINMRNEALTHLMAKNAAAAATPLRSFVERVESVNKSQTSTDTLENLRPPPLMVETSPTSRDASRAATLARLRYEQNAAEDHKDDHNHHPLQVVEHSPHTSSPGVELRTLLPSTQHIFTDRQTPLA